MKPPITTSPEGQKFLRSICKEPQDDTSRLMFADFLEEQDRPEQAEYVRLAVRNYQQIFPRLDAAKSNEFSWGRGYGFGSEPVEEFRWREEERRDDFPDLRPWLDDEAERLKLHRAEWVYPFVENQSYTAKRWKFSFFRGFPAWLLMPLKEFPLRAGALFSLMPIVGVQLTISAGRREFQLLGHERPLLFDSGLTVEGPRHSRLPAEIFAHLDRVGAKVQIRGARAQISDSSVTGEVISRAAVAYGRELAGLPPLPWPPLEVRGR